MSKEKTKLQLTSIDTLNRKGQTGVILLYGLAWVFVAVWYAAAWATIDNSIAYAALLAVVNTAFMVYLLFAFKKLKTRLKTQYVVEVTDRAIHFFKIGGEPYKQNHKCLELDKIEQAECYRYQDSGSMIIMSRSGQKMEIPMWCMPSNGEDLVECLKNRGIKILNI